MEVNFRKYRGAGILFYKKEQDQTHIALGLRSIRPQKGFWSIPGGKMEQKDHNNYLQCAIRETKEEYFSSQFHLYPSFRIDPVLKCRIIIPLTFEYHTYFYDVSAIDIKFKPNWEFSKVEWFKINDLPIKTHFGVKYALHFLKLYEAKFSSLKYH